MLVSEQQQGNHDSDSSCKEGVLMDILSELDRERSRRAELEAEIRALKEAASATKIAQESKVWQEKQRQVKLLTSTVVRTEMEVEDKKQENMASQLLLVLPVGKRELIAMQTERDGYKELVHVLTADNDAISRTMEKEQQMNKPTLPLHVVRILELMPYDPRAVQASKANEELYEWQVYKSGAWQGHMRYFPPIFRKLPILQPKPSGSETDATTRRLFPETPPKHCVLTNDAASKVYNLDRGYTLLPQHDGAEWEWVSGWRIDTHDIENTSASSRTSLSLKHKIDCDQEGWSYATDPQHFVTSPTELCWDNAAMNQANEPTGDGSDDTDAVLVSPRIFRRRRWARQRALKSYPHASEMTLHFLRLLSENARLSVMNTKLSDQLVQTKTNLTTAEDDMVSTKADYKRELDSLTRELRVREEMITTLVASGAIDSSHGIQFTPKRKGSSDSIVTTVRLEQSIGKGLSVAGGFASSFVSSASTAASNAFRKTSEDFTVTSNTIEDEEQPDKSNNSASTAAVADAPPVHKAFDWKKIGLGSSTKEEVEGPSDKSSNLAADPPSTHKSFDWKKIGLGLSPAGKTLLQGLTTRKHEEEVILETRGSGETDDGDDEEEERILFGLATKKKKMKKDGSKKVSDSGSNQKPDDLSVTPTSPTPAIVLSALQGGSS